jgi:CMP/dCMP kinase
MIIAIDGPSGAGKGTVARAVAARLGYQHVDTGAMYRAVAWQLLRERLSPEEEPDAARIATSCAISFDGGRVLINGTDVTREIRTAEIDRGAAQVARLPRVREALVTRQRAIALAAHAGVVMEGRDIGTVVFPNADVKIYLDASPAERARRRASDPLHDDGRSRPLTDVARALEARDRSDSTRSTSPLAVAADAIVIDTTSLPADAVVEEVVRLVHERQSHRV